MYQSSIIWFGSLDVRADFNSKTDYIVSLPDETIRVLAETICFDFFHDSNLTSESNIESLQSYWTRQMRIGTTERILTWNPFFTRNWFKTMLINTFSWPYYILTKCGSYYATYHFLHFVLRTVIYVKKTLQLIRLFFPDTISGSVVHVSNSNYFEANSKTFRP